MACFCTNTVFVLDPDLYLSIRIRLLLYKSGSGTASLDTGLLTSWKSIRLIRIRWDSNYFAGSGCDRTNFILLICFWFFFHYFTIYFITRTFVALILMHVFSPLSPHRTDTMRERERERCFNSCVFLPWYVITSAETDQILTGSFLCQPSIEECTGTQYLLEIVNKLFIQNTHKYCAIQ